MFTVHPDDRHKLLSTDYHGDQEETFGRTHSDIAAVWGVVAHTKPPWSRTSTNSWAKTMCYYVIRFSALPVFPTPQMVPYIINHGLVTSLVNTRIPGCYWGYLSQLNRPIWFYLSIIYIDNILISKRPRATADTKIGILSQIQKNLAPLAIGKPIQDIWAPLANITNCGRSETKSKKAILLWAARYRRD